jgi:hypothetical protein
MSVSLKDIKLYITIPTIIILLVILYYTKYNDMYSAVESEHDLLSKTKNDRYLNNTINECIVKRKKNKSKYDKIRRSIFTDVLRVLLAAILTGGNFNNILADIIIIGTVSGIMKSGCILI